MPAGSTPILQRAGHRWQAAQHAGEKSAQRAQGLSGPAGCGPVSEAGLSPIQTGTPLSQLSSWCLGATITLPCSQNAQAVFGHGRELGNTDKEQSSVILLSSDADGEGNGDGDDGDNGENDNNGD